MRRAAGWMLVILLTLLGPACGGGESGDGEGAAPTSSSTSTSSPPPGNDAADDDDADPSGTAATGDDEDGAGGTTAAGQPGPGSPPPSAGGGTVGPPNPASKKPPLAISASLRSDCVRAGGTQTITIRTLPESAVGYGAVYSDGKSGLEPDHYGGNKGGHTDAKGTWSDTWTIAPNAPPGPVRVDVAGANANGSTGQTTAEFAIANLTGECE